MRIFRLFLLAFSFFIFSVTSFSQGFLHALNAQIVDGANQPVLLRGIGLGGWLVPEGYMLHTSGFANSPTEIRNKIVDLIGGPDAELFYQEYRKYYVQKKDIDSIKAWGFNSIRLPMHYALLTPPGSPYTYLESGFAYIDSLLSWCKANEIYLILDLHCAPGGQNSGNISDYIPGQPSLWESAENRARTVALWRVIAERYVQEQWIGGYDLINETAWDLGSENTMLRQLFVDITAAVREVDQNHILFIEGNWYATDFNGLTPAWDTNMAYSFHKYWNDVTAGTINYLLDIRNNTGMPLWCGESGENSNSWFTSVIRLLEMYDIGWAWWPHKKLESTAVLLSAPITPEYQQLLNYWNGQGPRPTALYAKAALLGMARRLDIDSCAYRKDVVNAMFRLVYEDAVTPYSENAIPGTLFFSDYDMGRRGTTWQDADYWNVGNTSWNNGYALRNDGVDIAPCADAINNGFYLGWIESGEWVKYTINVAYDATYDLSYRYAATKDGGKIVPTVDGVLLGAYVNIYSSGGWESWVTARVNEVFLSAGKHTLQFQFLLDGFNVNYVKFDLNTLGEIETEPLPEEFTVEQNFPNPFNGETVITVHSPDRREVSVEIYSLLGEKVCTLADHSPVLGTAQFRWNGTNDAAVSLPSGTYFAKISSNQNIITQKIMYLK